METKVNYLVDTNIWLERLLDQDKSAIVAKFLDTVPLDQLFISDFALHSIGVIMSRLKKLKAAYPCQRHIVIITSKMLAIGENLAHGLMHCASDRYSNRSDACHFFRLRLVETNPASGGF
ncbi:MAG: hypothetical protein ACQETL_07865 [Bacteroidota bacterium]